jgi:hypothetical protein
MDRQKNPEYVTTLNRLLFNIKGDQCRPNRRSEKKDKDLDGHNSLFIK